MYFWSVITNFSFSNAEQSVLSRFQILLLARSSRASQHIRNSDSWFAAGLSPYEALQTANPLDDIRNAAQVRGVFTHAKWHSGTEFEARLAQVKEHSVSDQ